jgi:hypothetical protein
MVFEPVQTFFVVKFFKVKLELLELPVGEKAPDYSLGGA